MPKFKLHIAFNQRTYTDHTVNATTLDEARRLLAEEFEDSTGLHVFTAIAGDEEVDLHEDIETRADRDLKAVILGREGQRSAGEPGNAVGSFTFLEMEAALCVWEWINDVTVSGHEKLLLQDWITFRENIGSPSMRHASMELGRWCLKIYDICTQDDPDIFDAHAYDFDVIPAMMRYARDHNGAPCIDPEALPDPQLIAPKVLQDLGIEKTEPGPGYWKETPEAGLDFFRECPENPDFFPSYTAVSLRLGISDILELNRVMRAAKEVLTAARKSQSEVLVPGSGCMEVRTDDSELAFRAGHEAIRIYACNGRSTARYEVTHKHTGDRIVSSELSPDDLIRLLKNLAPGLDRDTSADGVAPLLTPWLKEVFQATEDS